MASGQCWAQAAVRVATIDAVVLNRSSRVMPGFLGTPAGITTASQPLRQSARLVVWSRAIQSNGCRPFGISALMVGFDFDGTPRLYQTDPSGTYHAWKANAIGRGPSQSIETEDLTIKPVIKALLEVVQSGGKNIELAVMKRDQPLKILNPEEIEKYVAEIEKEKEENEKKKQKKAS
uniref:Proteasome 20S subunit alpha 7 n=1 Tax=Canis lupus familiaris TaxID=9615 RepID=A0A8I3NBV3_CANLF